MECQWLTGLSAGDGLQIFFGGLINVSRLATA